MVENTIRMVNKHVPVKLVVASRGKQQRAEPIVALYEQQRVHHVGVFPQLEDQMCQWVPGGGGPSPDRVDSAIWGLSELLVDGSALDVEMWSRLATPGAGWDQFNNAMYGHRVY